MRKNMIPGRLTISRPQYGDGRKCISIQVEDDDARIRFLDIEIELDKFAEALTGLSMIECEMEVRGLQNVGKRIEKDKIEFEMPDVYKDKAKIAAEEAKKHTPEGWTASTYFGSQDSFFHKDGKYYARCTITRWVNK